MYLHREAAWGNAKDGEGVGEQAQHDQPAGGGQEGPPQVPHGDVEDGGGGHGRPARQHGGLLVGGWVLAANSSVVLHH
jgi:hypothetical protein